jgi:hypothetical protein
VTATILLEMRQMTAAMAPQSISTQQPAISTPSRETTMNPQSLPSRVNFDTEMEDTSQITNALSGTQDQDISTTMEEDGVLSPPRISKRGLKTAPAESSSTEETQESTKASTEMVQARPFGHVYDKPKEQDQVPQEQVNSQASTKMPLFSGAAPNAEALAKFIPQETRNEASQESAAEQGLLANEDQVQEDPLANELLPLYPSSAPNAEALAKFPTQNQVHSKPTSTQLSIGQLSEEPHGQGPSHASGDLLLFSGAAPNAEALANFSRQEQGVEKPKALEQETDQHTNESQEQEATSITKKQPNFKDEHTRAEALEKFERGREQDDHSYKAEQTNDKSKPESEARDIEPGSNEQSTVYDNDDPDSREMQVWNAEHQARSPTHQEDRQLESIWEKAADSVDRSDRTNTTSTDERTDSTCTTEIVGESHDIGREKRQRPLANLKWENEIRRVVKVNSVAIVQQETEPRQGIESPDRKKRAAPSPNRGEPKDDDESSMSSAAAEELANAVLNQIQEAPSEAIAPAGPRENA